MVLAQLAPTKLSGALQMLERLRIEPQMEIRLADGVADRRLDDRPLGESLTDLSGRAVERCPDLEIGIGLDTGPSLDLGGDLGQQVLVEELVRPPSAISASDSARSR